MFLLGFHMDCLDPPLLEIPQDNWYCEECFDSSDESEDLDPQEIDDLLGDVGGETEDLPESRLRTRHQHPQILRTMQSERIRNAILARMSLRGTREAFGEGPSTSTAAASSWTGVRRRRTTRKRRKARCAKSVVIEYDVNGSDKFAMRTKKVTKGRKRKGRKRRKKIVSKKVGKSLKTSAGSSGFKGINANVYDLQKGRTLAGLSNFNIFQPTNLLDYVPDEEVNINDSEIEGSAFGNLMTLGIMGRNTPQSRNLIIKKRVLQNCTTTSSSSDLLGSILQDQDMFGQGSIGTKFVVEKSSGKLLFKEKNQEGVKCAGDNDNTSNNKELPNTTCNNTTANPSEIRCIDNNETIKKSDESDRCSSDRVGSQSHLCESFDKDVLPQDNKKKLKKPEIDMFDDEENVTDDCPIFSIYNSVDAIIDQDNSSSFQNRPNNYDEENVDLVQMSDNNDSNDEILPAIVASQPASPDVEIDKADDLLPDRSYTPPIVHKISDNDPDKDERDSDKTRRDRESKRSCKRESSVKRYSVRDRLKDRLPPKFEDKFGRNRSRSSSIKRNSRRKSRSPSKDQNKKSTSPERFRRSLSRSRSRSRSRRRTPSVDYKRKKKSFKEKSKKVKRRSRSRSFSPRSYRTTSSDKNARSRSRKEKKKHREYSKDNPSTLTKEVFTSGQNILVSVNFNNQEELSQQCPKTCEPKDIVDITAKKKITVSSKPVAIIDLARSPFRELTPEYQSNVIELSDSEGEQTDNKQPPKSPDSSSKLYDPFDILNSPTNENVTSSQTLAALGASKLTEKNAETGKTNFSKNVMAFPAANKLFSSFEENLVSSSSSIMLSNGDKQFFQATMAKADAYRADKTEIIPIDMAESPYSPGHEYDDSFQNDGESAGPSSRPSKGNKNIFEDLFGSSTPPGLDTIKKSKKNRVKSCNRQMVSSF